VVLLITQRLNWSGVKTLRPLRQGKGYGKFANDGLASAGRCAHKYAVSVFNCLTARHLEIILGMCQCCSEFIHMRVRHNSEHYLLQEACSLDHLALVCLRRALTVDYVRIYV